MEDRKSKVKNNGNSSKKGGNANGVHPTILLKVWIEVPDEKVIEKVMHR